MLRFVPTPRATCWAEFTCLLWDGEQCYAVTTQGEVIKACYTFTRIATHLAEHKLELKAITRQRA